MSTIESKALSNYIGHKIKLYRTKKKLTQEELAQKVGTKKATISNYETGYRSPQQDMLFELAKVLEISINDLFPSTSISKNNRSIESIYSKLKPARQEKVYKYAERQLKEQESNKVTQLPLNHKEKEEIIDLAAHSEIDGRVYSKEEIKDIMEYLDQFIDE